MFPESSAAPTSFWASRISNPGKRCRSAMAGSGVWSGDGLSAQLNRNDTLPDRLSPGQVVVPGLAALTSAKDYSGRLDLYRGEFREQGGGMTATAFVEPHTDTLVVDVTG